MPVLRNSKGNRFSRHLIERVNNIEVRHEQKQRTNELNTVSDLSCTHTFTYITVYYCDSLKQIRTWMEKCQWDTT